MNDDTLVKLCCPNCELHFIAKKSDMKVGELGMKYDTCPQCQTRSYDENDTSPRTFLPTFPLTFMHTDANKSPVKLSDKEIQRCVDKVYEHIKECKPGQFCRAGTADVDVFGLRYEDSYDIIVAKNIWEDTIFND